MSLDVYLIQEDAGLLIAADLCYEAGFWEASELLREKGYARVYEDNITHNLNQMADAVGLYEVCWRPDEHGLERAKQLIEPLSAGLERLRTCPNDFRRYNPENGWGSYEVLVKFVQRYLAACQKYPEARVKTFR